MQTASSGKGLRGAAHGEEAGGNGRSWLDRHSGMVSGMTLQA